MRRALTRLEPGWAEPAPVWRAQLSVMIRFDRAVLALLKPAAPKPDTFLLLDGVPHKRLHAWFDGGFQADDLLQRAVAAQFHRTADSDGLLTGHAVSVARLACHHTGAWWWLAFARRGKAYTETEQHLATTLLRTIAARFEFPTERDLGRVFLDGGLNLLHVDTATAARLLYTPELLDELKTTLPPVIAQRWPQLDDHAAHSVFVSLDDRPTWVRFRRGRADDSRHWYLELRALDADDPPAVGLVEDPRVALALGYLADHFRDSPSLAQVATTVSTSPFHFHRLFTRQAAISPKHFLLRTQLMHAKQLLRAARLPIGEVAKATGFSSHGHFTATFNRFVGLNPSDYRDKL